MLGSYDLASKLQPQENQSNDAWMDKQDARIYNWTTALIKNLADEARK